MKLTKNTLIAIDVHCAIYILGYKIGKHWDKECQCYWGWHKGIYHPDDPIFKVKSCAKEAGYKSKHEKFHKTKKALEFISNDGMLPTSRGFMNGFHPTTNLSHTRYLEERLQNIGMFDTYVKNLEVIVGSANSTDHNITNLVLASGTDRCIAALQTVGAMKLGKLKSIHNASFIVPEKPIAKLKTCYRITE